MGRKKIFFNVVSAYNAYCKARIIDRLSTKLAAEKACEVSGMTQKTMYTKIMREGWETQCLSLLPALQVNLPTSTTDFKVIDEQRQKFLKAANKSLDQWNDGFDYLSSEYKKAKAMKNVDRCDDLMRSMNNLMLMLRRVQEVSSYATCDSGSALAPSESGAPTNPSHVTRIILAKEISYPRIPQPRPEPKTIELRVESEPAA